MLLHYLGKLKMHIFCRYSAHMEEKANKLHFYRLYLRYASTNFDIFSVYNSEFFSILIANKSFHVTVLLLVYFCDQFMAPEIRHCRRHSSVCQQSTWYSVTRTRFWLKTHTLRINSYRRRGIKIGAFKMQFVCIFFHVVNISRKFEFLISHGNVATCLRWGGMSNGFVANFIRFPAVQKFWKSVKIWQSYREFNGGNFFETQCIYWCACFVCKSCHWLITANLHIQTTRSRLSCISYRTSKTFAKLILDYFLSADTF